MRILRISALFALAWLAVLLLYAEPTEACSCMPSHPQTHYCTSDYVALVRVLRKSAKLVAHRIVYKVEIKKSYKMTPAGHKMLQHGRIATADSASMCGVHFEIGKLYVIAGRAPQLNLCHYAKEYKKMSVIERTGFNGYYRKGCSCNVSPCFGNQCLNKVETPTGCKWSPFAKCETEHSVCLPSISRRAPEPIIQCRWRRTVPYDECMSNP